MSSFVAQDDPFPRSSQHCSYSLTGPSLASQAIYICSTCSSDTAENQCCCSNCAEVCHAGHEVSYLTYGLAYCDCGQSSSCQLTHKHSALMTSFIHPSAFPLHDTVPIFQSYRLQLNSILDVNVLQQQCQVLIQRTKDTFWIDLHTPPRCLFESIALSIFQEHLRQHQLCPIPEIGGAEWWVQYKSDESPSRSAGIDLHYDKDEEIAARFGVGVFPDISTVTYLSCQATSLPTLILNCNPCNQVGDPIPEAYLSYPVLGKHVAFNGSLLHGTMLVLMLFKCSSLDEQPRSTN